MSNATYKLIVTVLVLVIVIGGGMLLYRNIQGQVDLDQLMSEPTGTEQALNLASDFTVTDEQGNEVKLSDFIGKPVVVNFWASWCGPCKSEMTHFQAAFEKYGDQIQFLMVNMSTAFGDSVEKAQAVLEEGGYTFPVYYDTTAACAKAYGITAIPMTLFVNADGELVSQKVGAMTASMLEARIASITDSMLTNGF